MPGFDTDLETSIIQLANGFTSLCNEYKLLAQRHKNLESRLAATTREVWKPRTLTCYLPRTYSNLHDEKILALECSCFAAVTDF